MPYNDHTDAEYDRREHAYELGALAPDEIEFERWSDAVVISLVAVGATTYQQGLDADDTVDGFSIDYAYEAFKEGLEPDDYFSDVLFKRQKLGFVDAPEAYSGSVSQHENSGDWYD